MRRTRWVVAVLVALAAPEVAPRAQAETVEERLERLEERIEEQDRIITEQQRRLDKRATETSAAPAAPAASPDTMRVYWKEGVRFETADKAFQAHVGGRVQTDFAAFSESDGFKDAFGDVEDGAEIRRARLMVEGLAYERIEFRLEYDFATGDAEAKDVYVGLVDMPYVGGIRVGHVKEPFSFDELTSSRFLTFLERALPNALAPSRNLGVLLHNAVLDERLTWAAGAFRNSDAFGEDQDDGGWAATGRLTGLPWYDDGGALVHLGVAASYRDPQGNMQRFRARPEAHLAPDVVDTGDVLTDELTRLGGELAAVVGPAWLQSEYIAALAQGSGPDRNVSGYYVQAGFFLTGERRPYKKESAVFDRVRPRRSVLVGGNPGPGAWEVAARWSSLDLNSGPIRGGQANDLTAGVNWYLNPLTRVSANYVYSERLDVGSINAVMMRVWFDF
ncbi:MAG TPA: porin [Candidatus Limnocylindria bacterium]|nr:porin [Candidatus Limnocylindria bacterium]